MKALRLVVALPLLALAAAANAASAGYPLEDARTDVSSLASLQRGARNFVNYCLGCHSLKYMRYSQVAGDLALTEDELRENLMFTGVRIYDPMLSAMPAEKARQWFGNAPPDLSLIVRSRDVDYVYTYLKAFYDDPSRPTGANNAVLPQTAMPNVLAGLHGVQTPRYESVPGADGEPVQHLAGLDLATPGEMTAEEFDGFVRDTVAFLEYVAEPAKAQRKALGVWVVLFLLLFTAFAWFLYKEYWKDVK
jgi:ubiquinol-cytochrome c reductase cytochrome c1 subunit